MKAIGHRIVHKMRFGSRLSLMLLCGMLLYLWSGLVVSAATHPDVEGGMRPGYLQLLAQARDQGSVRVIVGLSTDVNFQPEGKLSDVRAVQAQRGAIERARTDLKAGLSAFNVETLATYKVIPYVALEVDEAALQFLIRSPLVTSIEQDVPEPPLLESSIPVIGADVAWGLGLEGVGQVVVVLDTGVEASHPFFAGRVVGEACYSHDNGVDELTLCPNGLTSQVEAGAADPNTSNCWNGVVNICKHGTHVAGIAAGDGPSFDGVARGAGLLVVQIFTRFEDPLTCGGSAPCVLSYVSDQINALQWVYLVSDLLDISAVNMSLGGITTYSDPTACDEDNPSRKAVVDTLRSVGIATIAASGNGGSSLGISAPACISSVISVGATTDADAVASFSNSAALLDLWAPGKDIHSSVPGNGYAWMSGTSMATPHVAGAWTILQGACPEDDLQVDEILRVLKETGFTVLDVRNGASVPRIQLGSAASAPCRLALDAPAHQSRTGNVRPALEWGQFPAASEYQLQIDDEVGFSNPEIDITLPQALGSEYTPDTPLAGGLVYWRVRASSTQGAWGYWSDAGEFTIEPKAPADFDGEGISELVVFREGAWQFYDYDLAVFDHGVWTGTSAGCIPATMDYDGDGGLEFTQFCGGSWHFYHDDGTYDKGIWTGGLPGDLPVPADYDGDGTDDIVVWRNGAWRFFDFITATFDHGVWTGSPPHWLGGTSIPVPMDYDGDGMAEFTVFSGGPWHFYNDDGSYLKGIWTGGAAGDLPVPADYNGDFVEQPVIWHAGAWRFFDFTTGAFDHGVWTGAPPHWLGGISLPAPLDVDGNGIVDFTVFAGGPWHFYNADGSYAKGIWTGGVAGDLPISRRMLP